MFDVSNGIPRREFVKSAVAIGGTSALSACLARETPNAGPDSTQFPSGTDDPLQLPSRQFDWNHSLVHDQHGNTVLPQQQVVLLLEYVGDGLPNADEAERIENALRTLDVAYQHGTGGDPEAVVNDGLLYVIGYSRSYFDRFDEGLPSGIELPSGADTLAALGEDPTKGAGADAVLVLNSDHGSIVLGAEEALFGHVEEVNGTTVDATFEGIFETVERRSGFVGNGLPAERLDNDDINENAPMSMGFKSGFRDNQPSQNKVTITGGPFDGGTTLHVSRLRIDIDRWYGEHDQATRTRLMFSPEHDEEQVGETGHHLARDSEVTEESIANIEDTAREHGCVGHTQKTARARDDDFEARILRRSESIATDAAGDEIGFNFTSIQRRIRDFVETREAMNSTDLDEHVDDNKHGILDYLGVESRENFLVPPRERRSLPRPRSD